MFKAESSVFVRKDNFNELFEVVGNSHPDILKNIYKKPFL